MIYNSNNIIKNNIKLGFVQCLIPNLLTHMHLDQPFCHVEVSSSLSVENHSCHHKSVLISYHANLFFYSPIFSTPLPGLQWPYSPFMSANVSSSFLLSAFITILPLPEIFFPLLLSHSELSLRVNN